MPFHKGNGNFIIAYRSCARKLNQTKNIKWQMPNLA
jgi:hypothetical protein